MAKGSGSGMIKMRLKVDLSRMDRLEALFGDRVEGACKAAAEALAADIKDHWSSEFPSNPGDAPAVVTGNLDSSVKAERQGRSEVGRFAKDTDARVWFVTVDTEEGIEPNDRGQYGGVLEYGMDRPFMALAIERMGDTLPFFFKDIYRT